MHEAAPHNATIFDDDAEVGNKFDLLMAIFQYMDTCEQTDEIRKDHKRAGE